VVVSDYHAILWWLLAVGILGWAIGWCAAPQAAEPERKAGYQLLVCPPFVGVGCYLYGEPLASATACSLDLASLAVVLNKGTRISCVKVGEDRR
jgi:hypothetical protein